MLRFSPHHRTSTRLLRGASVLLVGLPLLLAAGCSRPSTEAAGDDRAEPAATASTQSGQSQLVSTLESAPEDAAVTADPRERVEVAEADPPAEAATRAPDSSLAESRNARRADAPQVEEVAPLVVEPPTEEAPRRAETVQRHDDPATGIADSAEPVQEQPAASEPEVFETFETRTATLAPGLGFAVEFESAVSSEWSELGDEVEVRLAESHLVDGVLALPAGSVFLGEVTEARPTRRFGGSAALSIDFHTLRLPSGDEVEVELAWSAHDEGQKKKDAARIGGGAAAGAVAGSVLKDSDGAKVGALIGAAIGATRAARDRGEPVEIPEGSLRTLVLDRELQVPVRVRRLELR